MKTKTETPRLLQKLLVVSLVVTWVVSMIQVVALAAMQYSSNPNLSGFMSWAFMTFVTPAVLVGVIYASRRHKHLTLKTLFEVATASVAALAIYGAFMTVTVFVPPPMFAANDTFIYYQLLSGGIPLVLTTVIMLAVLLRLRRSGQW